MLAWSAVAGSVAPAYRSDRILIQPKPGISHAILARFHTAQKVGVRQEFEGIGGLQVVQVPQGVTVQDLISRYQKSGLVAFAEPDYEIHAALTPNDPKYLDGTLWGLNNTGQNSGTADADIDAPEGWDIITSASNVVVAIVDSGIRFAHEDLASNIWVNPVDGSHGWNAVATNNIPNDDNGHGTLMAGVVGAMGNNGKGVTGVAWQVQMMAVKCLNSSGSGSDSDLIACIEFARTNGARIVNASLDSTGVSLALSNAIVNLRNNGVLFVASAGNSSANIDVTPHYPAAYNIDNILSVAYTTRTDGLGFLSDYGATNVDLAAPGDQVYSTISSSDTAYYPPFDFINIAGTSYAAAYVSGAAALLMAQYPSDSCQEIISRLLNSTDPLPSLNGKCRTGGRLNLRKALRTIRVTALSPGNAPPFQLRVDGGVNRLCVVEASTNLVNWFAVSTNTCSTNGIFDFVDTTSPAGPQRFYRVSGTP